MKIEFTHKNQLLPFNDNPDVWLEFLEKTRSKGSLIHSNYNGDDFKVIDWLDRYLGFRIIVNSNLLTFFPCMQKASSVKGILRGIGEYENKIEALRLLELPHKVQLSTFASDHVLRKTQPKIGQEISISFAGLAYSLSHQPHPPVIKRPDGKKITTKGSSIFYQAPEKETNDYIYQFYVEEVEEWLWDDFLNVFKIQTTLFRLPGITVPIYIYATERVLQDNYTPKKGDDILGVLWLDSKID
ncbi:MAG: hypothetical protein ACXAC7_20590 [Candidatus Hodarchaeales archaeon]